MSIMLIFRTYVGYNMWVSWHMLKTTYALRITIHFLPLMIYIMLSFIDLAFFFCMLLGGLGMDTSPLAGVQSMANFVPWHACLGSIAWGERSPYDNLVLLTALILATLVLGSHVQRQVHNCILSVTQAKLALWYCGLWWGTRARWFGYLSIWYVFKYGSIVQAQIYLDSFSYKYWSNWRNACKKNMGIILMRSFLTSPTKTK